MSSQKMFTGERCGVLLRRLNSLMRRDQSNFAIGKFFRQRFLDRFQAIPADFRAGLLDLFVPFVRKPLTAKRMRASADELCNVDEDGLQLNLAPGGNSHEVETTVQKCERFSLRGGERDRVLILVFDRGRRFGSKFLDDLQDFSAVALGFFRAESRNRSQLVKSGRLLFAEFVQRRIEKDDKRADLLFAGGGEPPLAKGFSQGVIHRHGCLRRRDICLGRLDETCTIDCVRQPGTDIALFARFPFGPLAEMGANFELATDIAVDEIPDFVKALPGTLFFLVITDLRNEKADCCLVALLPEQETIGGVSVAASPARFLVILFDAFRQGEVNYFTDAGLVDAEPEGDRANDNAHFIRRPQLLIFAAAG